MNMGAKGGAVTLDVKQLESVCVTLTMYATHLSDCATELDAKLKSMEDNGLNELSGGQGEFIKECVHQMKLRVHQLRDNSVKLSTSTNKKLEASIASIRSRNGEAEAETITKRKEEATLRRR